MKKRIIIALSVLLFLSFNYSNAEVSQQDAQRYSAYFSNGMDFYKNQQYSSAIIEFKKVLRFSPYDPVIQKAIANAYYSRAQYYQQTTKELKKALNDYKSAYFYAKYWSQEQDPSLNSLVHSTVNTINNLEKRLNIAQTPLSRFQSAKMYRVQGDLASAGYDFHLLKNSQYKSSAYENLGNIYKNLNNLSMGMDYIKDAIDFDPKNPRLHFLYGVMLDEARNFEASMEQYNLALQYGDKSPELMEILENKWTKDVVDNPNNAQGYINLGAIYQKQGKLEAAKTQYQKAYRLNPEDETILYNVASLLTQQKNYQGAVEVYDKILAKNPKKIEVLEYKATALKELMRFDEALEVYEEILAINPQDENAKSNKENIVFNHFSGQKLQQYLAQKANTSQNSYEAQFNYALELHKNKNYLSAKEYYNKALALDPTKEEVYINLAQILIEERNYEKANEICNKGLMYLPNSEKLNSYLNDVKTYSMSAKYNEASDLFNKKEYQKALDLYLIIPNKTTEINLAIASCYYAMNDYTNALKYYSDIQAKTPNNLEAIVNSSYIYYAQKDYNNAKLEINKALSLDKTNKEMQELLETIYEVEYSSQLQEAISLYTQGQYDKSFSILNSYLANKPDDEYGLYYKGLNLEEMKKTSDAITQYRLLISKKPNFAPAYYSLAVILDNEEKYNEAVENYEKFLSLKGNEKDDMTNFSTNRVNELKKYLEQLNANNKQKN